MYLLQNIEKMSHLLLPSPWKFLTTAESREDGRGGLLEGSGGNVSQKILKSSCSATPVILRGNFCLKCSLNLNVIFMLILENKYSILFYSLCIFF